MDLELEVLYWLPESRLHAVYMYMWLCMYIFMPRSIPDTLSKPNLLILTGKGVFMDV